MLTKVVDTAIKRQLVGLSRPHDGESQHASPDGKMSPEPYIVSPVSATGGKAHVHSPNIYPALGDSPSIQPRHSEDVANDGRPPDRAAPGQPQAALSLSPREKHPQGLPMDAVQPSVGARKTRKVATRQALSFSRPAKEGQAQLARMSPVSGCAGGESVALKEWEHDAHVEGLRQLRNYVGFVVPGLSENTSLNVEEIGLRADVAVGGIGMPGAAEGERGGMEDERKKKLLSFNEVLSLSLLSFASLFLRFPARSLCLVHGRWWSCARACFWKTIVSPLAWWTTMHLQSRTTTLTMMSVERASF